MTNAMATVTVTCWCESEEVSVPVEWIAEGRTRSCSPRCGPDCVAAPYDAFELEYDETPEPTPIDPSRRKRMTTIEYDPAADSSPETSQYRDAYPGVIIRQAGGCQCGCGGEVGRRSRFLPGHDAKLKGILQRAMAAEVAVNLVGPDGQILITTAENVARSYDWLEKVRTGADRIVRRSQTPVAAERRVAKLVEDRRGDEAYELVSFGRWERTGRAMALWRLRDGSYETVYATNEGTVEVMASAAEEAS